MPRIAVLCPQQTKGGSMSEKGKSKSAPFAWKERYPSITMHVKEVDVSDAKRKFPWLQDHKRVVLVEQHGQRFEAVIHNDIAGLLQRGRAYTIWYSHTDRYHDRYVEILCVNVVED